MQRLDAALFGSPGITAVSPATQRALLSLAGFPSTGLGDVASVDRASALQVPALSNGVQLLVGLANGLPLSTDQAAPASDANQFLARLDPDMPPGWTISRTVDSLVFYAEAWWAVTDRYASGFPKACRWLDPYRVVVDTGTGEVRVDGQEADPASLVRFPGVVEPILSRGAEAISTALANIRAARRYANNPKPQTVLTDLPGEQPMTQAEAQDHIDAMATAAATGKPVYVAGVAVEQVGWTARELQMLEARQTDAIEMARLLNLDPIEVGAPQQGTSLTYQNAQDRRLGRFEALAVYLTPIEQRLSMPDVTPAGARVTFDPSAFTTRIATPTPGAAA
jgi:hypothetical protein